MNKLFLFIALLFAGSVCVGQLPYPYEDIKLEKQSDYTETEPLALSAANYLLTSVFADADKSRAGALKFIFDWMTGNKDYSFYKEGLIQDIAADKNTLAIYVAAVTKFTLENKTAAQNPMVVEKNASKITLTYCDNPVNNFKLRKKTRKLLEKE